MNQPAWGETTTTDEVIAGIDLRGKLALVTGTSAGLGLETATALARAGAQVVMAARDAAKNQHAIDAERAQVPAAQLCHVTLDLADLASVRRAAAEVLAAFPRIDILVANAGIMACPLARTQAGCELQFGTNHIGHFLFINLLVPALRRSPAARVVVLSSAGHTAGGVDFDDPHFQRRPYDKWLAYGQAKTANILYAVALAARLQPFGITANAVHPGAIRTELGRHLTPDDIQAMLTRWKEAPALFYKTPSQGAATSVWAATAPSLAGVSGRYLQDCGIAEVVEGPRSIAGVAPYAVDPALAERLWTLSEQIVGERFEFR